MESETTDTVLAGGKMAWQETFYGELLASENAEAGIQIRGQDVR